MTAPPVTCVILYVRDVARVSAFYQRHFGLCPRGAVLEGWVVLGPEDGGCAIALHRAAVSQRSGAAMKVVFGVRDIGAFTAKCAREGLEFGPIHRVAEGYEYANAKDPAGNSISVSSRGLT